MGRVSFFNMVVPTVIARDIHKKATDLRFAFSSLLVRSVNVKKNIRLEQEYTVSPIFVSHEK